MLASRNGLRLAAAPFAAVSAARAFATSSASAQTAGMVSSRFGWQRAREDNRKRLAMVFAGSAALFAGALAVNESFTRHFSECENSMPKEDPMYRSKENKPVQKPHEGEPHHEEITVFAGSANRKLAESICEHLGTRLGRVALGRFADGEVSLRIQESIRGKDVYLVQPTSPPVNENLMELLLMISTCRRASAKRITAVVPYYGYARQDRKMSSRVPISAADVARLLETMGVDRVVAVDLHCGQIQGFFGPRVPVDNLEAQVIGLEYFLTKPLVKPVIVSPDAGGVYRARKFQEGLINHGVEDVAIAMLIKQRDRPNQVARMDLVGQVAGSDCIIVDDMIDTAGTLCEAARELKKHGALRVFAFATHGLLSGPAKARIQASPLEEVIVTDSIQHSPEDSKECPKLTQLSIAVLIADAIRRIHQKESLHDLFGVAPDA